MCGRCSFTLRSLSCLRSLFSAYLRRWTSRNLLFPSTTPAAPYHIMITLINMRAARRGPMKHDTLSRQHRILNRPRRCHQRIHANNTPENESDAEAREEARLEAIESRLRSTGGSPSGSRGRDRSPGTSNQQQTPIGQRATWKEGQLFPEGWEQMDPIEKATELYLGERGILYWSRCFLPDLVVSW